jgi:hypothetical protein
MMETQPARLARMISLVLSLAQRQTVFFVWVSLTEHKWVTLGERRSRLNALRRFEADSMPVSCRYPLWIQLRTALCKSWMIPPSILSVLPLPWSGTKGIAQSTRMYSMSKTRSEDFSKA